jgi:NTP pyrophosphatase (non-canonical NTP hydrolase)
MDLKEIVRQCRGDSKRWFPNNWNNNTEADVAFHILATAGEAGELANQMKKVLRGDISFEEAKSSISEEAIDVFIYLCNIFALLEVDPVKLYAIKRRRNEQRFGNRPSGAAATL